MESIVVGVDESAGAAAALQWAKQEGELHGAHVIAAMCWGYLDQHHGPGRPETFDPQYTEADARRALDAIVTAVVGGDAAASIERRTINDLEARGLLELAEGADLLVLGARGLGRFRELVVGSVSQRCLSHARVPVAVVRPLAPPRPVGRPRVVVGVDGSETSRRALLWAVEEGRRRQATVEAVHAWNVPYSGALYIPATATTTIEQAAIELLASAVAGVDTDGLPAPVVQTVACGSGGSVLVEFADGADLVVVGSRGLGGFKGLLLGSVGHQVSHHAPCPVVVVPHVE
jgi:nucleotide-binding universal stress UspA family protein